MEDEGVVLFCRSIKTTPKILLLSFPTLTWLFRLRPYPTKQYGQICGSSTIDISGERNLMFVAKKLLRVTVNHNICCVAFVPT